MQAQHTNTGVRHVKGIGAELLSEDEFGNSNGSPRRSQQSICILLLILVSQKAYRQSDSLLGSPSHRVLAWVPLYFNMGNKYRSVFHRQLANRNSQTSWRQ